MLDGWCEGRFAKTCRGDAVMVRYAGDFIACFQHQAEAGRFMKELEERLAAFSLALEPTKARLIRFGRFAQDHCHRDGLRRPATFNFLGFTHFVAKSRASGKFLVGRTTERRRMAKKLRELGHRLRGMRVEGGAAMVAFVRQHLLGHIQYYGVSGNSRALNAYVHEAQKRLFKWLNRRSQRQLISWRRYAALLKGGLLPAPRRPRARSKKQQQPAVGARARPRGRGATSQQSASVEDADAASGVHIFDVVAPRVGNNRHGAGGGYHHAPHHAPKPPSAVEWRHRWGLWRCLT